MITELPMDNDDGMLRALAVAVESQGGWCHHALHLRSSGPGTRGLFTTEALSAGELILRVPLLSSLVAWPHDNLHAQRQQVGPPPECANSATRVSICARAELPDSSECRCHPEDAIHWGLYSGDYVRLTCGERLAYAVVNPPFADSDSEGGGQVQSPAQGEVWIAPALHRVLGGTAALLEMVELEELTAIRVAASTPWEHVAASRFFGTTNVTCERGMLQDVANAAGLDIPAHVLQYWQRYIDDERCHMRPAWPGLRVPVCSADSCEPRPVGGSYLTRGGGAGEETTAEAIVVDAVIGEVGELLGAGFVGPRTRIECTSNRGEDVQSCQWIRDLAQRIYDEMLAGTQSVYHAYLCTLPKSCSECIWSWSVEELLELGNLELFNAASGWVELREKCIRVLSDTKTPRPSAALMGHCVDLVVSRTVRLHGSASGCKMSRPFRAMIPLFDLLNHGVAPNVRHSLIGDSMEVRAISAVDLGEEVSHNFGLTAEECLVTHGFLPADASFDLRAPGGASLVLSSSGRFDRAKVATLPLSARKALVQACSSNLESIARVVGRDDGCTFGGHRQDLARRYREARHVALAGAFGSLTLLL